MTLILAGGILCLVAGVILGFKLRQKTLLLFVMPFFASEMLAFVSGLCRGQFRSGDGWQWLLLFLIAQVVGTGYLVYVLKGTRAAASLLAVFSITYALFAAFVAAMSFANTWL